DVGAVVHRPADALAHAGDAAAATGAQHPHGHQRHGPVEAGHAGAVVGPGADDARHHGAVAHVAHRVAVVRCGLVADEVAAGHDGGSVQVGMVFANAGVQHRHYYVPAARGDAPRVRRADERQRPLAEIVLVVGRHGSGHGMDPLVAARGHDAGQIKQTPLDFLVRRIALHDHQVEVVRQLFDGPHAGAVPADARRLDGRLRDFHDPFTGHVRVRCRPPHRGRRADGLHVGGKRGGAGRRGRGGVAQPHRDGYRAFVLGGRLAAGTAVAWFFAASLVVAAPGLTGFLAGPTRVLIVTGALAVVTGFAVAGM